MQENYSKKHPIVVEEAERIPNKFTTVSLCGILLALLAACILNEAGIFEVDRITIWSCFGASTACCAVAVLLVVNTKTLEHPATKYVLMSILLTLTLLVNVYFNISVELLLLLPMFLATRYRSMRISVLAIIGTAVCALIAPIMAWALNAWSPNIMIGYLETTCHVSVSALSDNTMPVGQVISNLILYLSLPQLFVIAVMSTITVGITRNSISGVKNRVKVEQLTDNLTNEFKRVRGMQDKILYSMADIIESRDLSTGGHVKRTSEVVRLIVEAMRNDNEQHLSDSFCDAVIKAAPLHDLGKIGIYDAILRKQGPLNETERELIKSHTTHGAELLNCVLSDLEDSEFIHIAANIAMYHHECFDGSGYPEKLKGGYIPLEARIMAIADIYDALVSKRCYKDAYSPKDAFIQMETLMGKQIDPALNKYFLAVLPQIEDFYARQ